MLGSTRKGLRTMRQLCACMIHGILRWKLRNRWARKEQCMLYDLFKGFDKIKSSHKSFLFHRRDLFFIMRA